MPSFPTMKAASPTCPVSSSAVAKRYATSLPCAISSSISWMRRSSLEYASASEAEPKNEVASPEKLPLVKALRTVPQIESFSPVSGAIDQISFSRTPIDDRSFLTRLAKAGSESFSMRVGASVYIVAQLTARAFSAASSAGVSVGVSSGVMSKTRALRSRTAACSGVSGSMSACS